MNKFGKERERSQKGSGSLRQINGNLRVMQSFFPIQKVEQGLGNCILNLLTFCFVSMEMGNDYARPEHTIV